MASVRTDPITSKLATATLGVDPTSFRLMLDGLRHALERPPVTSLPAAAMLHDHATVAASVRHVLDRLSGVDLTAVRALSGMVTEYRSDDRAVQLRDVFARLQHGWKERVIRVLGSERVPLVARLLSSPAPDLLRILGKEDDENAHSDLIAWLLNPRKAPVIAPQALRRLTERFDDEQWQERLARAVTDGMVSVRREVVIAREFGETNDLARVDITVSGPGFFLAIENKVWSSEHSDQTQMYWSCIEPMRCLRDGLFLSPSGMTAGCPAFKAVSYLELVSCLVDGATARPISESEEIVLASYLKTLGREIIQVEMRALRELSRTEQP